MSAYSVTIEGRSYEVSVIARRGPLLIFEVDGKEYSAVVQSKPSEIPPQISITPILPGQARSATSKAPTHGGSEVKAPLPGIVSDVKVNEGDEVSSGATLLVIEAMKMENPIKAPRDGKIKTVHVRKGQEIPQGAPLISFE